jgi:hypothetical protein
MDIKISGFDDLDRQLKEAQEAAQTLDGEVTSVEVDTSDPESIERAVIEMRTAVDSKMAPYRNNPFVEPLIEQAKVAFEKQLRGESSDEIAP